MRTVYDLFPEVDQTRVNSHYVDIIDPFFWETLEKCRSFSMLSIEGFYNLYRTMEYVAKNNIPGDIVECGVFLGGAILAMSDFAQHFGLWDRKFYLYDTFESFPDGAEDVDLHGNVTQFTKTESFIRTVRKTLKSSLLPEEHFILIPGKVEDTLPYSKIDKIAVLRLDTDYYESTKLELEYLYPHLSYAGVLIVDDYGHFQGVRKATDDFFAQQEYKVLFHRVSYTIRSGIKL